MGLKRLLQAILGRVPYISQLRQKAADQGLYPVGHYYSPVPDRTDVALGLESPRATELPGIDLRSVAQKCLLEEFANFYPDLPFAEKFGTGKGRFYFDQGWFAHSDAIMLYGMIRKFRPKRIVEVGSGHSSAAVLDSLDAVSAQDCKVTLIEPHPERLHEVIDVENEPAVELLQRPVQAVEISRFESLEPNDLLLIDSSHVVKYGSDVHLLILNVLPCLKPGVIVHFHDIFDSFEYPEDWLRKGLYWNEAYVLRAFLAGNPQWRILLFNDFVNRAHAEFIEQHMPLCRRGFGSSCYIQRSGGENP